MWPTCSAPSVPHRIPACFIRGPDHALARTLHRAATRSANPSHGTPGSPSGASGSRSTGSRPPADRTAGGTLAGHAPQPSSTASPPLCFNSWHHSCDHAFDASSSARVPGPADRPEVLRRVVEVEDDHLDAGEVAPQELLQPAPAVADRDPPLGRVHPDLPPLPAERLAQPRPPRQGGDVPGLPGRAGPVRVSPPGLVLGDRVVDHPDVDHPPVRLGPARPLDAYPGRVGRDVRDRLAVGVLVPVPRGRPAEHLAAGLGLPDPGPDGLGDPLDRGFGHPQPGQLVEQFVGRLGEAVDRSGSGR